MQLVRKLTKQLTNLLYPSKRMSLVQSNTKIVTFTKENYNVLVECVGVIADKCPTVKFLN